MASIESGSKNGNLVSFRLMAPSIPHSRGKLLKRSAEDELIPGGEGRLDDFPCATVFLQTLADKSELA